MKSLGLEECNHTSMHGSEGHELDTACDNQLANEDDVTEQVCAAMRPDEKRKAASFFQPSTTSSLSCAVL